jgi:hypothetical protein
MKRDKNEENKNKNQGGTLPFLFDNIKDKFIMKSIITNKITPNRDM